MRSRNLVFIFFIGIGAFIAFGLMTKFAFESNPTLLRVGKMKQALAEELAAESVAEISVKSLPGRKGFELRIVTPKAAHPDPETFSVGVAEGFLRHYTTEAPSQLRLVLIEPAGFGCSGPQTYFEKEFSLAKLASETALRKALSRFEGALEPNSGLRVAATEPGDPLRVKLEASRPLTKEEAQRILADVRSLAVDHLEAGKTRMVDLSLWSPPPKAELLAEERIERSRQPRRQSGLIKPSPTPRQGPAPAGPSERR